MEASAPFAFEKMTKDVQISILKMLPLTELLKNIGVANKRLYRVVRSNRVWRERYIDALEDNAFFKAHEDVVLRRNKNIRAVAYKGWKQQQRIDAIRDRRTFIDNNDSPPPNEDDWYFRQFMRIWSSFVHVWRRNGIATACYTWTLEGIIEPITWIEYNPLMFRFIQLGKEQDYTFSFDSDIAWVYTGAGERVKGDADFRFKLSDRDNVTGVATIAALSTLATAVGISTYMYFLPPSISISEPLYELSRLVIAPVVDSFYDGAQTFAKTVLTQLLAPQNVAAAVATASTLKVGLLVDNHFQTAGNLPRQFIPPFGSSLDFVMMLSTPEGDALYWIRDVGHKFTTTEVWEHDMESPSILKASICQQCKSPATDKSIFEVERGNLFCNANCQQAFNK
jgi:hypothetical protein